jgi:hypothetical protein
MTPMRPTDQATSVSSHGHRRISSKRISVTKASDVLSRNAEFWSVPARCARVQTKALATSRKRVT